MRTRFEHDTSQLRSTYCVHVQRKHRHAAAVFQTIFATGASMAGFRAQCVQTMTTTCRQESESCFWDVALQPDGSAEFQVIVHKGGERLQSAGSGVKVVIPEQQTAAWLVDGCDVMFRSESDARKRTIDSDSDVQHRAGGALSSASAHW
jgi:hypothetical protein